MASNALDAAGNDEEGVLASINIIPFVDIVLVLLVIFMLTPPTQTLPPRFMPLHWLLVVHCWPSSFWW